MRTSFTRFAPAAAVLTAAMVLGAPSFAQTGGASNAIPSAGSKQDPKVASPQGQMPAAGVSTTTRAEVKAEANASNAIPNAGSKQDPQVEQKMTGHRPNKAERRAGQELRKAKLKAEGSASNPKNPAANPTGSAASGVDTSATPTSKN